MADASKFKPIPWTSYKYHYTVAAPPYFGNGVKPADLPRFESINPVIGYRVWGLDKETCQLMSCVKRVPWPFRQKMVRGTDNLSLGIHAAKSECAILEDSHDIYDLCQSGGLWSDYKAAVAGEIWMWGEVTECEKGYLSEFAYPKSLWMPESTDPLTVMQLEENYGVPVTLRPDLGPWKQTIWDLMYRNILLSTAIFPKTAGKNIQFFNYPSIFNPAGVALVPLDEDKKDEEKA